MAKKFYLTSAIPYVNAKPHIGHALEFVQADTISRYHKLLGDEVLLLSGGDENAVKNVQAAEKAGLPIQEFIDQNNELFVNLEKKLGCGYDVWQRGSDKETHYRSSQKLWDLCEKAGDIYKKSYQGLYCVGCEAFYEKEELNENGECVEHPGRKLEMISEENYFFKLSKYEKQITDLIESDKLKVVPEERKNEVLSFLKSGLKDISISRSNERAKNWGVPVPGDESSRMYVWMDALNIYQSGIGFGWDEEKYNKWWPADLHVIGKGIIRFHAIYWPAFLLSAGLRLPKEIFVHGYYTVNGQKMSKTIGNVFDPIPLLEKYGADPLRYFMLAKTPPFADGDFSEEKFIETYNSDLANGLGNLVARVAKLCEKLPNNPFGVGVYKNHSFKDVDALYRPVANYLDEFRFNDALSEIWKSIKICDSDIEKTKAWTLEGEDLFMVLDVDVHRICHIAWALQPFMPETAQKILKQFGAEKITAEKPLFPRIK